MSLILDRWNGIPIYVCGIGVCVCVGCHQWLVQLEHSRTISLRRWQLYPTMVVMMMMVVVVVRIHIVRFRSFVFVTEMAPIDQNWVKICQEWKKKFFSMSMSKTLTRISLVPFVRCLVRLTFNQWIRTIQRQQTEWNERTFGGETPLILYVLGCRGQHLSFSLSPSLWIVFPSHQWFKQQWPSTLMCRQCLTVDFDPFSQEQHPQFLSLPLSHCILHIGIDRWILFH